MTMDLEQFHDIFFQESEEALDTMEQTLLAIDAQGMDEESINTVFRVAHSIKGGSATFGFEDLTSFTHTMETLLDLARSGEIKLEGDETDLLLRSVDVMRDLLAAASERTPADSAWYTEIQDEFERRITGARSGGASGSGSTPAGVSSSARSDTGDEHWRIEIPAGSGLRPEGTDPLMLLDALASLGEARVRVDASSLPSLAELDPERCHLGWSVELPGTVSRADLEATLAWAEDAANVMLHPPRSNAPAAETPGSQAPLDPKPAAVARPAARESSSIRVSIEKLDELINTVGELVITQSMLSQLATALADQASDDFRNGLAQLERQMRALQESVMRVRMLPISVVFNRFPRMVRDLGMQLSKEVELRLTGEQTELDKTVLEKIGDPLVHLVRNSIDHGIEDPETRIAAGKPRGGSIHLNAYHKGGNITVEISDDGAGLDRTRLLAKARERGLIGPDEEPSDERVYNLIFHPGFSTAAEVSDVSGRGVGMDVVRRNIAELGGSVQIFSTPGEGSMVRIRLPLTLAILDGQLVRIGREVYVIPLVSIVETIQIRRDQVSSIAGGTELLRLRDEYLPIIRLYDLFGVEPDSRDLFDGLLTIVEADGRRAGILADELLAQQQVVIKSLEANFRQLPGLSGATMLGDGHVALILDVPGLLASFENDDGGPPGLARSAA